MGQKTKKKINVEMNTQNKKMKKVQRQEENDYYGKKNTSMKMYQIDLGNVRRKKVFFFVFCFFELSYTL